MDANTRRLARAAKALRRAISTQKATATLLGKARGEFLLGSDQWEALWDAQRMASASADDLLHILDKLVEVTP